MMEQDKDGHVCKWRKVMICVCCCLSVLVATTSCVDDGPLYQSHFSATSTSNGRDNFITGSDYVRPSCSSRCYGVDWLIDTFCIPFILAEASASSSVVANASSSSTSNTYTSSSSTGTTASGTTSSQSSSSSHTDSTSTPSTSVSKPCSPSGDEGNLAVFNSTDVLPLTDSVSPDNSDPSTAESSLSDTSINMSVPSYFHSTVSPFFSSIFKGLWQVTWTGLYCINHFTIRIGVSTPLLCARCGATITHTKWMYGLLDDVITEDDVVSSPSSTTWWNWFGSPSEVPRRTGSSQKVKRKKGPSPVMRSAFIKRLLDRNALLIQNRYVRPYSAVPFGRPTTVFNATQPETIRPSTFNLMRFAKTTAAVVEIKFAGEDMKSVTSWFPHYEWTMASCTCGAHVGWRYHLVTPSSRKQQRSQKMFNDWLNEGGESFYGLIYQSLTTSAEYKWRMRHAFSPKTAKRWLETSPQKISYYFLSFGSAMLERLRLMFVGGMYMYILPPVRAVVEFLFGVVDTEPRGLTYLSEMWKDEHVYMAGRDLWDSEMSSSHTDSDYDWQEDFDGDMDELGYEGEGAILSVDGKRVSFIEEFKRQLTERLAKRAQKSDGDLSQQKQDNSSVAASEDERVTEEGFWMWLWSCVMWACRWACWVMWWVVWTVYNMFFALIALPLVWSVRLPWYCLNLGWYYLATLSHQTITLVETFPTSIYVMNVYITCCVVIGAVFGTVLYRDFLEERRHSGEDEDEDSTERYVDDIDATADNKES
eukprot:GHVQ01033208.1.p1 GENE.GHVQ01033208.1~~GHVQ01033208.1.p1  ORF type:complete len:759 (-),score=115.76 GHVQ01033208.1:437-2713(-)